MQKPLYKFIIVLTLFVAAFVIRLYNITRPPLDFAPIRQYQNAHNARGMYLERNQSVSDDLKEVARLNMQRMGYTLEPRVTEQAAVLGYRLTGGERLWIPRMLSAVFWVAGGVFLYLTAIRLTSAGAAIFSAVFYLFLPYGILASRSFQPDPLMVMMLLVSIYTILVYHDRPSVSRLLMAASASACAMFVKPYCVFLIFGAFIPLLLSREGIKRSIFNKDFWIFSFVSLLPAFLYYGYMTLSLDVAQGHVQETFLFHLLLRPYFWKDWLVMIGEVVGYIPFVAAIAGFLIIREKKLKVLLSGLWVGYFIFGVLFTFHIHTHSYYQLQFIPVAALSIGPVGAGLVVFIRSIFTSSKRAMITVLLMVLLVSLTAVTLQKVKISDYKEQLRTLALFAGVNPGFKKFLGEDFAREVRIAEEIGEIVGHSTKTLFLTPYFGRALAYHGRISGFPWPTSISLRDRKEHGIAIPDKVEIFNSGYFIIKANTEFIRYTPDYFIIIAFDEFDKQPDLKEFLFSNFPVLARNEGYLIFDLRKMSE